MRPQELIGALDGLAELPGIEACALVDMHTGLVWAESSGTPHDPRLWEASIDYWRLQGRQKDCFKSLGALGAAVMYHTHGVLAIVPCCREPDLLLVAIGKHGGVDWIAWQRRVRSFGALLKDRLAPSARHPGST